MIDTVVDAGRRLALAAYRPRVPAAARRYYSWPRACWVGTFTPAECLQPYLQSERPPSPFAGLQTAIVPDAGPLADACDVVLCRFVVDADGHPIQLLPADASVLD